MFLRVFPSRVFETVPALAGLMMALSDAVLIATVSCKMLTVLIPSLLSSFQARMEKRRRVETQRERSLTPPQGRAAASLAPSPPRPRPLPSARRRCARTSRSQPWSCLSTSTTATWTPCCGACATFWRASGSALPPAPWHTT